MMIILDRSDHLDGKIWFIDPTNAHFYQKKTNKKKMLKNVKNDGPIWIDIVTEIQSKLDEFISCKDWSVILYRMLEIPCNLIEKIKTTNCDEKMKQNAFSAIYAVMMAKFMDDVLETKKITAQSKKEQTSVQDYNEDEIFDEMKRRKVSQDILELLSTVQEKLKVNFG